MPTLSEYSTLGVSLTLGFAELTGGLVVKNGKLEKQGHPQIAYKQIAFLSSIEPVH